MTNAVHDIYSVTLAGSGKLKLRAKALLADGGPEPEFRACVLLHEAARMQRRATEALLDCPPQTRLASAVEECWCLVEGLDPPRASNAWGDVLRARQAVDAPTADAIVHRLAPRYDALHSRFVRAVHAATTLRGLRDAQTLAALGTGDRVRARKELARVLAQFPGAASFWWMSYRLAEADGDKARAWNALGSARRLDPENPRFAAMSVLVAASALPFDEAETYLAGVRGAIEQAEPELCLMYALAEITLARDGVPQKRMSRWILARLAAEAGSARATSDGLRKNLRAVQLILGALIHGREPTMDLLYLAGLGELASTVKANADVVALLTTEVRDAA
jgi:hypothetical protein